MSDKAEPSGPFTSTPFQQIQAQISALDDVLASIPFYGSEETKITRQYLIGQIEALKWVMKVFSV